jgi:hypothetical protein
MGLMVLLGVDGVASLASLAGVTGLAELDDLVEFTLVAGLFLRESIKKDCSKFIKEQAESNRFSSDSTRIHKNST